MGNGFKVDFLCQVLVDAGEHLADHRFLPGGFPADQRKLAELDAADKDQQRLQLQQFHLLKSEMPLFLFSADAL